MTNKAAKRGYTGFGLCKLLCFCLLLLYGALIGALHSYLYNDVVLHPFPPVEKEFKDGAVLAGIKGQDCYFDAVDGSRLHGFLFRKPCAKTIVLFHHGNAGNIAYRMSIGEKILRAGASVLLYDYRGYGKSTGKPTVGGLVEDGFSAYDFTTKNFTPSSIINYGESIGTGVACQVARQRSCGGLILQSSIGSLPRMAYEHFSFLKIVPDALFPSAQLDNVEAVKSIHVPLLMVHGEKDTLAPITQAELVYANANRPKRFVSLPLSGHNDVQAPDALKFTEALKTFVHSVEKTIR